MTDSRPLSYLSAGQKLGKYEIKKLIGRGGMAEVYQAFNPDLHVDVAIKILYPQTAESEKAIQRFRHEARAIAALNHANIVRTFDFDSFENLNYMVMELVEGPSLKDVISRFPQGMPVHQALELFRQIADAVAYAHDHNVIHRDLKPGNILIAKDGRPLLTDFGLALIGGNVRLTGTEVSIGTPQYMSPEQAQGAVVGPQTDIYSLGVILYEMLVGDVPFQGDSFSQILLKLLQEKPKLPSRIVPNIDPQIDHVVERALAKSPGQRFLSVRDMLMDLGLDTPRPLTFDLLEGGRAGKGEAITPAPRSTRGSSGSRTLTRSAQLLRTTTTGIKNNPILSVGVLLAVVLGAFGAAVTTQLRSLAPTVSANSTPTASITVPEGMVYIPGGRFKMGSAQGSAPESPPHDVNLAAYFIDRTEVTNKQYLDFVVQTGYAPPKGWQQKSANWVIEGTRGFAIGTPQDRFSYDGKLVSPIQGSVRFDLNSGSKTGEVIAEFTGTLQIRFGSAQSGRWRIVHNKFSSEQTFFQEGIATNLSLHGDTGREGPFYPRVTATLSTWGTADVYLDDKLVFEKMSIHTMYTKGLRNVQHQILKDKETCCYSADASDKGYIDPNTEEIHILLFSPGRYGRTSDLDAPWLELYFNDVTVKNRPDASMGIAFPVGATNQPVTNVTWRDAAAFCEWKKKRLPSEAEWELAARGTQNFSYPWGNTRQINGNIPANWSSNKLSDVGQYEAGASPFGSLDMAGNAWEWVNDWYQPDYYTSSPVDNPTGPTLGEMRVLRGGGYTQLDLSGPDEYRTTYRLARRPDLIDPAVGLRCALTVRQ